MSKKTDKFERDVASSVTVGESLPNEIPKWMLDIGIKPGAKVTSVDAQGAQGGKTDILIKLSEGSPIKISAKMSSADYFGNWYSHSRILRDFGVRAFENLTKDCTKWANEWVKSPTASFFVGVSICFGKRSGKTAREFTEVFDYKDIVKIVAGTGQGNSVANCLLVSNKVPNNLIDLITKLKPINNEVIQTLSRNFKVVYRPINPKTEGSNRSKCTYTQFRPKRRLNKMTQVDTLDELVKLGRFEVIQPNGLNHNRLIENLKAFNINIPKKR
ncbi:hypothetical protein [Vibrio nigripulchritudo]|uniref:hypothetical protein n=1 Tax=Vibrio nigripulchritudo TaxID=28173 RepID=UPI0003B1AEF1|nr:hypothetical protein [Vibrio nigripulchritudo]CCN71818.1 conserved hypothetical protein [Vibrio nigripulchritudo SFn118]